VSPKEEINTTVSSPSPTPLQHHTQQPQIQQSQQPVTQQQQQPVKQQAPQQQYKQQLQSASQQSLQQAPPVHQNLTSSSIPQQNPDTKKSDLDHFVIW